MLKWMMYPCVDTMPEIKLCCDFNGTNPINARKTNTNKKGTTSHSGQHDRKCAWHVVPLLYVCPSNRSQYQYQYQQQFVRFPAHDELGMCRQDFQLDHSECRKALPNMTLDMGTRPFLPFLLLRAAPFL